MSTKCNGCDAVIYDILYMKCEQEECKKLYHLKCLALTKEKFESFTEEYKLNWRCPECVCSIPKRDNSETPVRGNPGMNTTFSPCYVNAERGGRISKKEMSEVDNNSKILQELREFRFEMKLRMEEQVKEYALLKNMFIKTETELLNLREIMTVVQKKASKLDDLEAQIKLLEQKNKQLQDSLSKEQLTKERREIIKERRDQVASFANVVKINEKKVSEQNNLLVKNVNSEATKPPIAIDTQVVKDNNDNGLQSSRTSESDNNQEKEEWRIVQKRKKKYPNSQVIRGGCMDTRDIQGTEKKKFLHVWRLRKDTKEEHLEMYVKSICGKEVEITVEKVKHKTERDYASFIIGVPESLYDKLCKPECWAVNIEFCEWIWFRKRPNTA